MKFINKHIEKIYAAGVIAVLIASYIKTLYAEGIYAIPIMVIPACMMLFGVIAGPLGSLIAGITGTIIVCFVF